MSTIARCDRCGTEKEFYNFQLPQHWERVSGCDLCENCIVALHEFLQPLPKPTPAEVQP